MLQAKMVGNLQQAEIDKYEKRLAQLQPKIDAYLSSGYSVELVLIVEKPKRPDVLCGARVFCDQGQLIYFRELYISYVESVEPVMSPPRPTTYPTIGPRGGKDGFVPYTHQGGSIIEEKDIPYLSARSSDYQCAYRKLTLQPQRLTAPFAPRRSPAPPPKPKPRLDPAVKKALALAPSRVYLLPGNMNQLKTSREIEKKLAGNPSFVMAKEYIVGGGRSRTLVSYFSDVDKPRAEALAAIVRAEGLSSAYAEQSGDGSDAPGSLQIFFGKDAEK